MEQPKLSPRLQTAADMVQKGARLIDVGTDHGYLPVYLCMSGIAAHAVGADINKGPLDAARANADKYAVAHMMDFALTDGLEGMQERDFDTVTICGMGGETMIHIIENAGFIKERGVRLILQPQTKITLLRGYLAQNGWRITREKLCRDAGRLYVVMAAEYVGGLQKLTPCESMLGRCLFDDRDPLLKEYVDELIDRTDKMMQGMLKSEQPNDLRRVRMILMLLCTAREEIEQW